VYIWCLAVCCVRELMMLSVVMQSRLILDSLCGAYMHTVFRFHVIRTIIIKNEKIRVTLCENAAGALYIVNKMCVDSQRNVQG